MQNLDMERKREIILQKLKLEYEVILQNTTLENVMRYLAEKLKGISGVIDEPPQKDGTLIQHNIQNVIPWQLNEIKVEYTDVVIPKGNIEKSHGYWGNYVAMNYEGMQLQTNTVKIKAECRHPFILPIFDRIWADMLKDFGANEPAKDDEATKIKREALIKMAGIYSDATDALNGKPEKKPKQKGRYRLTAEEIKFRKKKVKEAEKMKKDNPQKQWKEIDKIFADEIGSISDRTFRDWRHTHYS